MNCALLILTREKHCAMPRDSVEPKILVGEIVWHSSSTVCVTACVILAQSVNAITTFRNVFVCVCVLQCVSGLVYGLLVVCCLRLFSWSVSETESELHYLSTSDPSRTTFDVYKQFLTVFVD